MEDLLVSPAEDDTDEVDGDDGPEVELVDLAPVLDDEGGDVVHPPAAPHDEEADALAAGLLSDEARYARWQARKPPTAHLQEAIVWPPGMSVPVPAFDVGTRVVVEQRSSFLDPRPDPLDEASTVREPWLRTVVGTVTEIDDEAGLFWVNDEASDQRWPRINCFSFDPRRGCVVLMAPARGNPFDVSAVLAAARAAQRAAREAEDATLRASGQKRGRGRPPGAKNRPKDVVKAEREALRKIRAEKAAKRAARRAGL